ncbi:DUF2877 domain-containing protein [Fundicoccus culcitae]|uniref:DUF2877 domain-containing protein n=1 Tax=Fundicoccus culcitae TaxID=2969821 RepID=A0ABY5P9G6_9LACT|nr:DUF2877 domain-containing protein [Fundicoccus culcitae]UUX35314.1 DUF2877 domain-containing protein [Fundicoccus culcitae]
MQSAIGLALDSKTFKTIKPLINIPTIVRIRNHQMVFYTRPEIITLELTACEEKDLSIISIAKEKLLKSGLLERLKDMNVYSRSGFSKNDRLDLSLKELLKNPVWDVNALQNLIGAGPGLTPSGDDFLQGMIFIEKVLGVENKLHSLVEEGLKVRLTTDVSLSYYQAIFEGYANEPLINLLQSIQMGSEIGIQKALNHLQNYGETSGYDLLLGILVYLQKLKDGMML